VSAGGLSHLGPDGRARMVDVGEKAEGERMARARAVLRMSPETARTVAAGDGPKGEIVTPARIAGIAAAKRTGELIPLAHPLPLTFADVNIEVLPEEGIARIEAEARVVGRTGVEMEAMTACTVAALTVYDMVKGLERGVTIESIELVEKLGGRSGHWRREAAQQ
jgi:cyclic pyranopterin monophosphate synthase